MTTARALARTGLLGNPSDGYGGRVIAMALPAFAAEVTVEPSTTWRLGEVELFEATLATLRQSHPDLLDAPAAISFITTIPRQVGLAGSSALIIALLRALGDRADYRWDPIDLARTALHIETVTLGWSAGPQDRVVQAYEGVIDMDFAEPWQASAYQPLDPAHLPPLFVAWNQSMGTPSDVAHSEVRARWETGDPEVRDVMHQFASLAAAGREAFDQGRAAETWPALMRRAFELRASIWNITSIDETLVQTGEGLGAGVAFAGSGGAVVGCVGDPADLADLANAYAAVGAGFTVVHA